MAYRRSALMEERLASNRERILAAARRLIAEQRTAIERTLDHETDLAGMRRLASPDRLLDTIEHALREHPPGPPMVLEEMPGDTPDAHAYQLPEAPPPPKLPPPPLKPPPELEPPLQPPPLPDQPPE